MSTRSCLAHGREPAAGITAHQAWRARAGLTHGSRQEAVHTPIGVSHASNPHQAHQLGSSPVCCRRCERALAASHHHPKAPVQVTVLSPGPGDHSGQAGVGFIVDVSLDATRRNANALLSPAAGYKPFFHDPTAADSHPGPDQGAPGLVAMLSSTPVMPGTPFMGPGRTSPACFRSTVWPRSRA